MRRVVVIGPAHRVAVRGVAIPSVDRFETPLGTVDLDRAVLDALAAEPNVVRSDRAHAAEHALEVQLPFLQEVLGDFTLVPLVVGDATPDEVAAVLDRVWGGPETLIVVSSDLSHYLPYDAARRVDAIDARAGPRSRPRARSSSRPAAPPPINALMRVARRRRLRPRLLAACNSGDTAGDRDARRRLRRAFRRSPAAANGRGVSATDDRGPVLLAHARHAIESLFGRGDAQTLPDAPFLDRAGATFVTLRLDGELRGCIGIAGSGAAAASTTWWPTRATRPCAIRASSR